jgi:ABC-type iron transport system FetAB permease component
MASVGLGFGLDTCFICDIIEQFHIQGFIVLLCKSSNASRQEKKLSPYKLCSVFSALTVSPVAVALVAVTEAVSCFLSLPN